VEDSRDTGHGIQRRSESAPCRTRSFGHDTCLAHLFGVQRHDPTRLAVINGPQDDGFGMDDTCRGHGMQ